MNDFVKKAKKDSTMAVTATKINETFDTSTNNNTAASLLEPSGQQFSESLAQRDILFTSPSVESKETKLQTAQISPRKEPDSIQ